MKKLRLLTIIGIMVLSCSKSDDNQNLDLFGQWNWISSSGGITGTTQTPETTGEIRKLEISSHVIKSYLNGRLNSEIRYTIETRNSLLYNEPREMIVQNNDVLLIFDLNENELVLTGDCNDCFSSTYVRE